VGICVRDASTDADDVIDGIPEVDLFPSNSRSDEVIEAACRSGAVDVGEFDVSVKLSVIEHSTEFDKLKLAERVKDLLWVDDPVGIEPYASATTRDCEVQMASGGENPQERVHSSQIPIWLELVTISPKPEVLDRMEARKGRNGAVGKGAQFSSIISYEGEPIDFVVQRSEVYHFNVAKREQVGNEAIDTRADIDVTGWVRRKDLPRGPQISMEIVPLGNTRAVRVLGHDRKRLTQEGWGRPALLRGHLAVL
jgi:hypothetical protein